jgi:Na+/H+ antiporter NhaD/arsenite permease-like protein
MEPTYLLVAPFIILLGLIAIAPLIFSDWWGKHYSKVSLTLGAMVIAYYVFVLQSPEAVLHSAEEYFSFIVLIGSLYIVSGGIHISTKDLMNPWENTAILLAGAILANILGTTGASMLLIRPWIKMNKTRIEAYHIVFFIFIVSNAGGSLTPIGDPPLFLGYLKGIPFFWITERMGLIWISAIASLLTLFYLFDFRNYRRQRKTIQKQIEQSSAWKIDGAVNFFFLGIILLAVFIQSPLFLREGVIIIATIVSYFTTKKSIHAQNHFSFHPIREVAILFAGIFATMVPALELLRDHAETMRSLTPGFFYWNAGILSSFLDNAPTYVSFLSVAVGNADPAGAFTITELLSIDSFARSVVAISSGAVFFGAMTYIGNGPNFHGKIDRRSL